MRDAREDEYVTWSDCDVVQGSKCQFECRVTLHFGPGIRPNEFIKECESYDEAAAEAERMKGIVQSKDATGQVGEA